MRRGQNPQPINQSSNFPLFGILVLAIIGIVTATVMLYNRWRDRNEE